MNNPKIRARVSIYIDCIDCTLVRNIRIDCTLVRIKNQVLVMSFRNVARNLGKERARD